MSIQSLQDKIFVYSYLSNIPKGSNKFVSLFYIENITNSISNEEFILDKDAFILNYEIIKGRLNDINSNATDEDQYLMVLYSLISFIIVDVTDLIELASIRVFTESAYSNIKSCLGNSKKIIEIMNNLCDQKYIDIGMLSELEGKK